MLFAPCNTSTGITGVPSVALNILVQKIIQLKPVKSDTLHADTHFREEWAHFSPETVAVHAAVERGVTQANQARQQHSGWLFFGHDRLSQLTSQWDIGEGVQITGGFGEHFEITGDFFSRVKAHRLWGGFIFSVN